MSMKIPLYLAMTSDEINHNAKTPENIAWMSIRFDQAGDGLFNFPSESFSNCILILDDYYPYTQHNCKKICQQLKKHIDENNYNGLLLDFQRQQDKNLYTLAHALERELPCKVAMPPNYCNDESIVFLPPPAPAVPPEDYLKPWTGHEIWLDLTTQAYAMHFTIHGISECEAQQDAFPFYDKDLCTHYNVKADTEGITFSFRRTREDCMSMLEEIEAFHVRAAFSLYREMEK